MLKKISSLVLAVIMVMACFYPFSVTSYYCLKYDKIISVTLIIQRQRTGYMMGYTLKTQWMSL